MGSGKKVVAATQGAQDWKLANQLLPDKKAQNETSASGKLFKDFFPITLSAISALEMKQQGQNCQISFR